MTDDAKAPYIAKEQANCEQYKLDKAKYSELNTPSTPIALMLAAMMCSATWNDALVMQCQTQLSRASSKRPRGREIRTLQSSRSTRFSNTYVGSCNNCELSGVVESANLSLRRTLYACLNSARTIQTLPAQSVAR